MPSRSKTNKDKFLKNCDDNGRLFYNYFFDKVEDKGYKPGWGDQGVRYYAMVNGSKVAFFIGYPNKDYRGKYVCVDFSLIGRKINDANFIAKAFRPRFLLQDFIREGSYVKWFIKKKPTSEKMYQVTNLYFSYPRGGKIVHDPKLGVVSISFEAFALQSISNLINMESINSYIGICVFASILFLGIIIIRKRF